jgi:hypothetical protein
VIGKEASRPRRKFVPLNAPYRPLSHLMDAEAFDFKNLEISTELTGIAASASRR